MDRMTKGTDLLDDITEVDEGEKATTDYDLRVLAMEVGLENHINPDTAATTKQAHVQGGDEDDVVSPGEAGHRRSRAQGVPGPRRSAGAGPLETEAAATAR